MIVWFTSDTHFQHHKVSQIRGFATPAEHDEALIRNWNKLVRPDDLVWHLGDVGMGNESSVLALAGRLHGHKQLIAGNHDPCWPGHRDARKHQRKWLDVFDSVQPFARVRLAGENVLLSHFPYKGDHTANVRYQEYRLRDEGLSLIHGHTHSDQRGGGFEVHVGLDAWGLKPVRDSDVIALLGENLVEDDGHEDCRLKEFMRWNRIMLEHERAFLSRMLGTARGFMTVPDQEAAIHDVNDIDYVLRFHPVRVKIDQA